VPAAEFPYQIVSFPMKYLGIPLSIAKLLRSALQPLVDTVADRLPTWKGQLMRRSGRLILIKTTLQAIPIYVSISLQLPSWVHKALQKIFKAFLWTGTDMISGDKCLVAWSRVQRPMHMGGLGVLDLRLMGIALRVRWMWLQRIDSIRPWSVMLLETNPWMQAFFRASTIFVLGDGSSFFFWTGPWVQGKCVTDFAPELLAVVSPRHRQQRMVA
jgi:hypothetical protein